MPTVQDKVIDLVQDAHAMERSVLRMLDSMISQTDDARVKGDLVHHRDETERHERALRERLEALGADTSTTKEIGGILGAFAKSALDATRPDQPFRHARDAFMTEHMEIATYKLIERIAVRAGDEVTARIARENCADEIAMAEKIADSWEHFATLELVSEHVTT